MAVVLVAVGVVAVLVALLADTLGIGGQPGFGWKQGVLLGAGVLAVVVGAAMLAGLLRPAGPAAPKGDDERGPGPASPPD